MMQSIFALVIVLFTHGVSAGWCDDWGVLEWSDEFDGEILDSTKWNIVCNDMEGKYCGSLPFHTSANGAECRSATCIPEAVSVDGG